MTFEQLQKANESIKTMDIKGKEYAEVNQRIKVFRMLHPDGCIKTEIVDHTNGVVVMRAEVFDDLGRLLSTGTAYEKETSSFINKTSYIENCETSAVGRALGLLGIGIDTSVASYEEVANAVENQKKPDYSETRNIDDVVATPKQIETIKELYGLTDAITSYGGVPLEKLPMKKANELIEKAMKKKKG